VKFKEGDRVVTCGQTAGLHANGYYFGTKVYEAKVRVRDGALIWKLVETTNVIACGTWKIRGNFASPEAVKLARVYAKEQGLPFVADVKDKQEVEGTRVPRSQAARVRKRVPKGDRLERIADSLDRE